MFKNEKFLFYFVIPFFFLTEISMIFKLLTKTTTTNNHSIKNAN